MLRQPFFILLVLCCFSSCSKVSRIDRQSLKGSYEWYYSFDGETESFSYAETTDQYGIFIKANGAVMFYKNGEMQQKGRMESFESTTNSNGTFIVKWDKWTESQINIMDNELVFHDWPFTDHSNYFTKTDN